MTKTKFYLLIIIVLALLNGVLLFLHFNRPDRPLRPRDIIIERLQFDEQQIKQYEELIVSHQAILSGNEAKINGLKNIFYQQLNQPSDSLKLDSLAQKVAELQKKIEIMNFRHFESIRHICKAEQLPLFEKLSGELSQLFMKKNQPQINNRQQPKD